MRLAGYIIKGFSSTDSQIRAPVYCSTNLPFTSLYVIVGLFSDIVTLNDVVVEGSVIVFALLVFAFFLIYTVTPLVMFL